ADLSGNYEIWKSKLKIRFFDNARIYENANIPSFLGLDYFIGRDKIEVENEYKKLIADIEDCLPYTVCKDFKEEKDTTDEGIMTATFRITSVKDNYYASLKRSELHVR